MTTVQQSREALIAFIALSEEIGDDALELFDLVEEAIDRYELIKRVARIRRRPQWEPTFGASLVSTDAYMSSPFGWSDMRHFHQISEFN